MGIEPTGGCPGRLHMAGDLFQQRMAGAVQAEMTPGAPVDAAGFITAEQFLEHGDSTVCWIPIDTGFVGARLHRFIDSGRGSGTPLGQGFRQISAG
jgi:hypothetical protein